MYGCVAGFGLTFISGILIDQQTWLRLFGGLFPLLPRYQDVVFQACRTGSKGRGTGLLGAYASTFLLTVTNPLTILSFAAIFAGLGLANTGGSYVSALTLVLGVFLGSASWWLLLSGGVGLFRDKFNTRAMLWVTVFSGGNYRVWGGCIGRIRYDVQGVRKHIETPWFRFFEENMNNQISLTVNGITHTLETKPGETLSALLRQRLRLTGTKIGCEEAECGACTVLVDGEPVVSCIYPAERADGKTIVTIEGLAQRVHEEISASLRLPGPRASPLARGFIRCRRLSSSMAQSNADSASPGRS